MVAASLPFVPSLGLCWDLLQRVGDALGTQDRAESGSGGMCGYDPALLLSSSHPRRTQEEELQPGGLTPLVSFSPYTWGE